MNLPERAFLFLDPKQRLLILYQLSFAFFVKNISRETYIILKEINYNELVYLRLFYSLNEIHFRYRLNLTGSESLSN
jgi:hypothetical protein